jgi:hypothetical protein
VNGTEAVLILVLISILCAAIFIFTLPQTAPIQTPITILTPSPTPGKIITYPDPWTPQPTLIKVYSDANGTSPIKAVDWGNITSGQTTTQTVYLMSNVECGVVESSWVNLNPQSLNEYACFNSSTPHLVKNQVSELVFMLTIYPNCTGITQFEFTIQVNIQ